jgi:hypothetical protein
MRFSWVGIIVHLFLIYQKLIKLYQLLLNENQKSILLLHLFWLLVLKKEPFRCECGPIVQATPCTGALDVKKNNRAAHLKTRFTPLRSEIILGHRKPGERLAIDDLKARFGTSVTPVRDALQMLNQEGLITIKPRSGYFITRSP